MPSAGGTVRLAQLLGCSRAREVCLGGADLDADTVERQGWIKRAAANGVALVSASQRFAADMAAADTLDHVHWLMANGGQTDGAMERDLGTLLARYPRALDQVT